MKILKYLLLSALILILVICVFIFFYVEGKAPQYEGQIALQGINEETEVYFDSYGVPHIYAGSDEDAYFSLGYVHAQDRLWQMELIRRIAPGRLSEVFGAELVKTDRFFKTLGIQQYSLESVDDLESRGGPVLDYAKAYLAGVNSFVENGSTPIEYDLIGLEKTPFTLLDVHNVMGYMAFSFAVAHKTEPVVSYINRLPPNYLDDLLLFVPQNSTVIRSAALDSINLSMNSLANSLFDGGAIAPFIGSNSWVVSPQKSATGKVLFSNDPHIGFSQPAVWYEAHVVSPNFNYYGYHLAGVPFATISHNQNLAIGLTMFENDDLDFYREKVNPEHPNQYQGPEGWQEFQNRKEVIKVKDSSDVAFTVRESRHGPIMNDAIDALGDEEAIAAWWTYFKFPNRLFDATYQISVSKTIDDVRSAAALIHAPGLNVMYGDAAGNIAWWATGKLVQRPEHVNSKAIIDGSDPANDPIGYYDFTQNPQAENPSWGYVYSANNQSEMNIADSSILYPGYYLPDTRASRIVSMLEEKEKISRQDMKAMFLDSENPSAKRVAHNLTATIQNFDLSDRESDALQLLSQWDGAHRSDTKGAQVFYAWIVQVFEDAMKDEFISLNESLGEEMFKAFTGTHLMKKNIYHFLELPESIWWDDVSTEEEESRQQIVLKSFRAAIAYLDDRFGPDHLEKPWPQFHTLEHGHTLGQVETLRPYFNVGPFEVSGADMALNNLGFSLTKEDLFKVTYGPSTRRIVDFADVNSSESILPTGQSGNIFSPHYKDQAELYANGRWRPMLMDRTSIQNTGRKLVLKPNR